MSESRQEIPFDDLPDGFAGALDRPPTRPARPRAAATVVLLRPGTEGLEVLLLRRNRKTGFVPGAYVFPGGRVDPGDGAPELLERVDGLDPDAAARRLDLPDGDPPATAYYLAAVREAFEETGILVGRGADGGPPPDPDAPEVATLRDDLMEDRIPFARALDVLDCRVLGDDLEYIAHWVTPEAEPRRYDTRFFAAAVPGGCRAVHDPREMLEAVWLEPGKALERNRNGDLPMVFPTIHTLEGLTGFDEPDQALEHFAGLDIPAILPRLVRTSTGVAIQVDEETP